MKSWRKLVRTFLTESTLTNFWDIVREAKITKDEQEILDMRFVSGMSIQEISYRTNRSPDAIKKIIARTYDKLYKLM